MNKGSLCRCCLTRPPDKKLKTTYTVNGKPEIYGDMLKECFEIYLPIVKAGDDGICNDCIFRLRNAADFKERVIRCQEKFHSSLGKLNVKNEIDDSIVKVEYFDLDDDIKEEFLDDDSTTDEEVPTKVVVPKSVALNVKTEKVNGKKPIVNNLKVEETGGVPPKKGQSFETITNGWNSAPFSLCMKQGGTKVRRIKLKDIKVSKVKSLNERVKNEINLVNVLKYSNCLPFSRKTLMGIACAFCNNSYKEIDDLQTHYNEKHKNTNDKFKRMGKTELTIKMDITDLKCSICKKEFSYIKELKKHLTESHNIKFFPNKDFIYEFKMKNSQTYKCIYCDLSYETFKSLQQHMNGHYKNYICSSCGMGFINQYGLKTHMRTHDIGSYKCNQCDKVFSTLVKQKSHVKYLHKTTAKFIRKCPYCDETFNTYYQRNSHLHSVHNKIPYKCNICDKIFIIKGKLTEHIKNKHLMERNHVCTVCGKGFFIKRMLNEHMITHNGPKIYKCDICHKAYARIKTLRNHMRIHNNDRRYKCGLCSAAFVQKCSLKSHMLSNHGLSLMEYENQSG